ncbi:MAG TPA: glycosyltransferase family 4 protein [Gemmatimonadales bacterium]
MRVLFLHQTFPSRNEEGSGRPYDFARQLVKDGHEVTIVAAAFSYLTGSAFAHARGLVQREVHPEGFMVLRTWTIPGYHAGYIRRVISLASYMATSFLVALFAGKYDVIVAGSPPITVAMVGGLVARLKRTRFVLEIRDLWFDVAVELGIVKNRFLVAFLRWWERSLERGAAAIVINSPGFFPHLERNGVPRERITLVPNGVDTALFRPDADITGLRAERGLTGKFVTVYAGSLGVANDIDTILNTAELLRGDPAFVFLLIGDGNRRQQLQADAERRGLTSVTFTGPVPKQDVPRYLCAADVSVCTLLDTPLFRTVYPNKIFDAMACGRPVVTLVDGVIRQVVEESGAGIFVHPSDAAGLAAALQRLKASPEEAKAMGQRGRAAIEAKFDRWNCARLMSDTLKRVTA